jgi:hypothetical protein
VLFLLLSLLPLGVSLVLPPLVLVLEHAVVNKCLNFITGHFGLIYINSGGERLPVTVNKSYSIHHSLNTDMTNTVGQV